jgi:hypothetical protein
VRAPKGSKAIFMDKWEHEFLLPRDTTYRIVDVEEAVSVGRSGGAGSKTPLKMRVVTLEIVP